MKLKRNARLALILTSTAALIVTGCATHHKHAESHTHGPACGHVAVLHDGHTDYLHDGHLHHAHGGHSDEHTLAVSATNPSACAPGHQCAGHDSSHQHGKGCGHEAVPHGDHTDYLVSGHLHHPHTSHCDDHGTVTLANP